MNHLPAHPSVDADGTNTAIPSNKIDQTDDDYDAEEEAEEEADE